MSLAFSALWIRSWFILGWLTLFQVANGPAAEPPSLANTATTNPLIKPVGPGVFELDGIRFDKQRQTVSFAAAVNMKEGNLEYLLVTTTGKTHESLLRTQAKPLQIQLVLLLLGARGTTNTLPEDPARPVPGDPVDIELAWTVDGQRHRFPAEQFVTDRKAGRPMTKGHWIYTGSRLREDGFAAQIDGSIVSLITDGDAMINNPRPGREDDDNWMAWGRDLPPLNAPVEVTVRLRVER